MEDPLFAALFNEETRVPSTVSELNSEIKSILERSFSSVWVEGEISGFKAAASGHWYFSLTDGSSFIKAACFKGQNFRIRFKPSDGLLVRVRGRVTTYEARGEYQIIVESLEPVGEGALAVAFEQIKSRLAAEGLFDEALKRPIPQFPRRVGVVTSPTGAALHDILTVLDRRARSVDVVLIPTLVQGEKAGEQIVSAIKLANAYSLGSPDAEKIDVLIVGRGGGSAEDLWAFNEEQVARAIRASEIPVISAVGHEVDLTISDLAADLRAPTPSAAAEIVARAEAEITRLLEHRSEQLFRSMGMHLLTAKTDLQSLTMAPVFSSYPSRIKELRFATERLDAAAAELIRSKIRGRIKSLNDVANRMSPAGLTKKVGETRRSLMLLDQRSETAGKEALRSRQRLLDNAMAKLDAMSPLRVLDRGYSITQLDDGRILRDTAMARIGQKLKIRLARGKIEAETTKIEAS